MSATVIAAIAVILVAVVLGTMVTGIFNKLVVYRNRYKNAFAQIEVQLKRRHDLMQETLRLAPLIEQLDVRTGLPLLDIALPALRGLTGAQYQRFKQNISQLVQADDAIDLFEWSLHRILLHELQTHHSNVPPTRVRHHAIASLQPQCELLLSILAHAGQRDTAAAAKAFEQGRRRLNLPQGRLRRAAGNGLAALDDALDTLEEAAPRIKRQILQAAVACITADDMVTATEAELLRAISASLGCPMPPLLLT
ncbi:MAG TPA: hypothetical protein VIK60_08850 [Vicinamibacterales bacterium]